jgi:hypothetical protein
VSESTTLAFAHFDTAPDRPGPSPTPSKTQKEKQQTLFMDGQVIETWTFRIELDH